MLTIRNEQLLVFERASLGAHVEELLKQLRSELPEHVRAIGEPAARALIEGGLSRAAGYGFTTVAGAAVFVKLLFALGEDFDRNPALPCAAILGTTWPDEATLVRRLLDALVVYARGLAAPQEG